MRINLLILTYDCVFTSVNQNYDNNQRTLKKMNLPIIIHGLDILNPLIPGTSTKMIDSSRKYNHWFRVRMLLKDTVSYYLLLTSKLIISSNSSNGDIWKLKKKVYRMQENKLAISSIKIISRQHMQIYNVHLFCLISSGNSVQGNCRGKWFTPYIINK